VLLQKEAKKISNLNPGSKNGNKKQLAHAKELHQKNLEKAPQAFR